MKKKLIEIYKKMSSRERGVLFFTLFVILALLIDRFVVEPVHHNLELLSTDIREEEKAIRKSLHVLVQKDRIVSEQKEFMVYSVEAKNPEEEMVGLLKEIQAMADHASVSLLYVKPATAAGKEGEGVKKYYASLECEAQMEQVTSFFHSVENSTKLLKIERYEIQPKTKDSSIARCTMTISKTVLG